MPVSIIYPEPWKKTHSEGQQYFLKGIDRMRIEGMDYTDKEILALVKELLGSETSNRDIRDRAYVAWSEKKDKT